MTEDLSVDKKAIMNIIQKSKTPRAGGSIKFKQNPIDFNMTMNQFHPSAFTGEEKKEQEEQENEYSPPTQIKPQSLQIDI